MGNLYANKKLHGSKLPGEAIFQRMNFDLLIVKKDQNVSLTVTYEYVKVERLININIGKRISHFV
jgi:hypothetical protein